MVSSTHWLASQSAMAVLEDGGNAYDAAVGGRLRPARRRTASQRPRRRGADHPGPRRRRGAGAVRAGRRPPPGRASTHYTRARPRPRPRHRPAGRRRARRLRRLDAAAARPRHQVPRATSSATPSATPSDGHPAVERVGDDRRDRPGALRDRVDHLRRGVPARRAGPGARRAASATPPSPPPGGGCSPSPRRPVPGREQRIEAARRIWREGFIAEALVRQSARPTMDTRGERHTGTLTGDDLAGWSATYEAPATYDWNGWTVCKAGRWSQGPAFLQQLALLPRPPDCRPTYGSADVRPPAHRGQQARHGRPRGLVRRRRRRRRPARRPAVRPATTPHAAPSSANGLARAAARQPRRARAAPGGARHRRRRRDAVRRGRRPAGGRARASRPSPRDGAHPGRHLPPRRRRPLGQHGRAPRPAAAGCSPTPSCPSWASRSAPGSR